MTAAADTRLRTPEVARRLGIPGADVYQLIFAGELDGRPDREGIVHVTEASVVAYLQAHGAGNVSNNMSNESRRTSPNDGGRTVGEDASDLHEHGRRRTRTDDRGPTSSGS